MRSVGDMARAPSPVTKRPNIVAKTTPKIFLCLTVPSPFVPQGFIPGATPIFPVRIAFCNGRPGKRFLT